MYFMVFFPFLWMPNLISEHLKAESKEGLNSFQPSLLCRPAMICRTSMGIFVGTPPGPGAVERLLAIA
jgi:hypothetical protein